MTKLLLIATLSVVVTACGGGGGSSSPVTPPPPPPPPAEGTVLDSECDGYDRIDTIADGSGGSYTERFPDQEECGYIAPTFSVEIDDTFGDRFKPVEISVAYTVQGEPAEWTYETDLRSEKEGDTLRIWGRGVAEEGTVLINGEPFLVQLSEEPRCAAEGGVDCMGYKYRGSSRGLIYYGEADTQSVTWELIGLQYVRDCDLVEGSRYLCAIEPSNGVRDSWRARVLKMNKALRESGVFIELVLKDLRYTNSSRLEVGEYLTAHLGGDIGLGRGTTCPNTCGCAYARRTFFKPGFGWSVCQWDTDLHEIGHAVGLAHGPENDGNRARGYVFPEFGHGWNRNLCAGTFDGDLMSYEPSSRFFNSLQQCREAYPDRSDSESPVTDRSYADSAYHLNRVRYDVSVINDEYAPHLSTTPPEGAVVEEEEEWRVLIHD